MSQRGFHRRQWLRNLLFVAAAGAIGVLAFGEQKAPRLMMIALEAQDAASLCAKEGTSLADFWQRAEVMGVGGVVIREEPLKFVAQRGGLLMFSRDEVDKWKAAGLVSPSTPLKPGVIWIKDPEVLEQVLQAAGRYGVAVTTSVQSGYHLVHFPDALAGSGSLEGAAMGVYDPDIIKSLTGRRLTKVFVPSGLPEGRVGPVLISWSASGAQGNAAPPDMAAQMPAVSDSRLLETRGLSVDASLPHLLQAVYSHPARLLLVRLSLAGVEPNFEKLRGLLQELKRRDVPLALPSEAPASSKALDVPQRRLVTALLLLFGAFGPLLAARGSLTVLKRTRVMAMAHWPVATPVIQLLAAAATAGVGAIIVGLSARSCFDSLGQLTPSHSWSHATMIAPLIIALLTLYTIDLEEWRKTLALSPTYARLLELSVLAVAAVLLVAPRKVLGAVHLQGLSLHLETATVLPWWWSWRWREILVGWPCLLQAFFLINWRMDCPDCASLESQPLGDPRTWFMLGLFAPIGIVVSVGQEWIPRHLALGQTGWAMLAGLFIGLILVAVRLRGLHGPNDPRHHGTIDLDAPR